MKEKVTDQCVFLSIEEETQISAHRYHCSLLFPLSCGCYYISWRTALIALLAGVECTHAMRARNWCLCQSVLTTQLNFSPIAGRAPPGSPTHRHSIVGGKWEAIKVSEAQNFGWGKVWDLAKGCTACCQPAGQRICRMHGSGEKIIKGARYPRTQEQEAWRSLYYSQIPHRGRRAYERWKNVLNLALDRSRKQSNTTSPRTWFVRTCCCRTGRSDNQRRQAARRCSSYVSACSAPRGMINQE